MIQLPTVDSDQYCRLMDALEYAEDNAVTDHEAIQLRKLRENIMEGHEKVEGQQALVERFSYVDLEVLDND